MKRKSYGKETSASMRPQRRRRRNSRNMDVEEEAHDDDDNINGKDSSSDAEVRLRKRRKRSTGRAATLNPSSSSVANHNGNCAENNTEVGISPGLVWNPEILAWGRGGTRSNTRHGNNTTGGSGSSSSKSVRNARVNRLVECLRSSVDGNSIEVRKRFFFFLKLSWIFD